MESELASGQKARHGQIEQGTGPNKKKKKLRNEERATETEMKDEVRRTIRAPPSKNVSTKHLIKTKTTRKRTNALYFI